MIHTTLISTEALGDHLDAWRVFDCRHDLMQPALGAQQYEEGHIPGALFARLDRDLSAPRAGRGGRHPLPYPGDFLTWLGEQGLEHDDQVVCYDAGGGVTAARLWWMLRWVGHDAVAVLDGGLAKWQAEGRPLTTAVPRLAPSSYPMKLRPDSVVGIGALKNGEGSPMLLDARAPARFRGEHEPIDPVAGHIPGALNRFCNDNLGAGGTFKSPETLKKEFLALLAERSAGEVVNYCGSGVSACHNILAMEIAGLNGSRLYAGSWSDWISDPDRPVAR
jgi:thiosulfate/3-mercaptopyruvate sulfurtransferase